MSDILKSTEKYKAGDAFVIGSLKISGVPCFAPIHLNPWWGQDILERIRKELVDSGISII
jgi:hypothetical protein